MGTYRPESNSGRLGLNPGRHRENKISSQTLPNYPLVVNADRELLDRRGAVSLFKVSWRSLVSGESEPLERGSAINTLPANQNAPYKLHPLEFRHRGFRHNLIERLGEIAIYRQSKSGLPDAFEVVRIQKREAFSLFDKDYPATETYPRDEAWGVDGFTYRSLDEAERKFRKLTGNAKEVA